ncbi:PREDICTED: BUB3-interacting and GLEBS motif-containing protein ZNF207-like [Amphimedon queenslandica]|uniref:BED-type domain-containing protein n=1 Tax=Amphimedon queenslandica TaxID=400682 RepID=A0A1X7VFF5_AMPQE|nr:PREDICTED: BUB3-interacting and GLEBS motif-containing protein ZNF207-like [Amphimedon queenslandica]|eukprot:XP_003384499.2 PREDICTED: BUB3-interacting and GLEBS motif-containing protein ZNF207-like [Amphimedon queenslandica]
MGRKKRKNLKPWCWYCNREFDDEKVLIGHQKAKHFKCHICHKKLYTAPGLAIHCSQVHKETITKVPNALLDRSILDFEIYGMEGVPEEARRMREIEKYGSASDDGPDTKRLKTDGLAAGVSPVPVGDGLFPAGPPGLLPGVPPVLIPGMPPIVPGMIPAPPRGIPMVPPASAPTMTQPLFPSAVVQPPTSAPPIGTTITSSDNSVATHKEAAASAAESILMTAALVVPLPENSLLMHPKQDLSMEEIRSLRAKYNIPSANSMVHSSLSLSRPPPPPMGGMPTIRPGMGPLPISFSIRPLQQPPLHGVMPQ